MPRPARFVVRLHQAGMAFPELAAVWREADALGYDGASLFDLIAAPCLECWTALTALTTLTQRLIAVPLVLANDYRHPAVLAKMAATLDALSGGRLVLGLGAGGSREDYMAAGLPWRPLPERLARLEEAVRAMRFLWSGREGEVSGPFYGHIRGPGWPPPARPAGPPVLIGGHGRRYLLRTVARAADICNVGFDLPPQEWEEVRSLLASYCREEGRDPAAVALGHNATVVLGESRQEVASALARLGLHPEAVRQRMPWALVGTPQECLDRLERYLAVGVSWFFLLFPELPADARSLRLFASAVLPALGTV